MYKGAAYPSVSLLCAVLRCERPSLFEPMQSDTDWCAGTCHLLPSWPASCIRGLDARCRICRADLRAMMPWSRAHCVARLACLVPNLVQSQIKFVICMYKTGSTYSGHKPDFHV